MKERFRICPYNDSESKVIIHPKNATKLGLNDKEGFLHFGIKKLNIMIEVDDRGAENLIFVSENCVEKLNLQALLGIEYEIVFNENNLYIGPFIGFLVARKKQNLKEKLHKLQSYVKEYKLISGTVIAFSLEGIDKDQRVIVGYFYNPVKNKWIKGRFPFPSAIYRMIAMKQHWREFFYKTLGNKIFNSSYLSKWEIYCFLKKSEKLTNNLPYTVLYEQPSDVIELLNQIPEVYIKPHLGSKGKGIIKISKFNDHYIVKNRLKDKNSSKPYDEEELLTYLLTTLPAKKFIIQEAIPLLLLDQNKIVDFRIFASKGQEGKWKVLGFVGRSGASGSIVSNRSSGGKVDRAETLLEKTLRLKGNHLDAMKAKIIEKAYEALNCFDQDNMNFGYFAIDIGIDYEGEIWILEMNHRNPNDLLPLYVNDEKLYQTIKTSRILYLSHLAGF